MTANHHTPIATGAPGNSNIVNAPLGQLDQAIDEIASTVLDGSAGDFTYQQFLAATPLTITAGGAITPTRQLHTVTSNSGTTDNLDTITMDEGRSVELVATTGHTITIRDGIGNLYTFSGSDMVLTEAKAVRATRIGSAVFVIGGGSAIPLPISEGGTNATTQTAAFDNLSPTTTKGDLIVSNGSDNVRLPVGADYTNLEADSADSEGIKWVGNIPKVLFMQTADATHNASLTETTILGTGVGSLTLPAGYLAVGSSLLVNMGGYFSLAAGTVQFRLKLGGVEVAISSATTTGVVGPIGWNAGFVITCRSTGGSGTVYGQGWLTAGNIVANGGTTGVTFMVFATATATVDTTAALAVDVTLDWSSNNAGNLWTTTNAILQGLRAAA